MIVSRSQGSSPGATGISGLHSRRTRGDRHSSRVEAKNPAMLTNRDGYLLELTGWTKGSKASCGVWREVARLDSRPCRRRRPSALDDGGNLGVVLERRPQCAVSHEVRRRGQLASRGAPGKSGLHASGEGERVIAPEPWEGTLASRRVEEGLSRSFPG